MKTTLFFLAVLFTSFLYGQAPLDSLAAVKQVDSLIQESRKLAGEQNFEMALEINAAAEKIALENLGRESAAFGSCCFNKGRVTYSKGNHQEAEIHYLESMAIREKILGKEHPDYAWSLNNLGLLYTDKRDFLKAEQLLLESLAIREQAFGKEDPLYAASLSNLSRLYVAMGDFEKAEPLYIEALAIREKKLGKEHPKYVESLLNLMLVYLALDLYEIAEPLCIEALALKEKSVGKEHPDYSRILIDLAIINIEFENYDKAEQLLLEGNANLEKNLGKNDINYLAGFLNLAEVYLHTKKYDKAEPIFLEAKEIFEVRLNNRTHPFYKTCMNNMGMMYYDMGNYKKAELFFLESRDISEKIYGKDHPRYANSYAALAGLYEIQQRYNESETMFDAYYTLKQTNFLKATAFLSEQELANYTVTFKKMNGDVQSVLLNRQAQKVRDGILPALDYNHLLFQKGFLLAAAVKLNKEAKSIPEAEKINQSLQSYRNRLSTEYSKPIADRKNVAELEEKANSAEKELARMLSGYTEAARQVKWQEVQSVLKKEEAAIEFIHFQFTFPKNTDSTMYAALVLLPGNAQPKFVPLFEEKELQNLLKTTGPRKSEYVNGLYTIQKQSGKSLFELVWQPLENALAGAKTVYFSPSGLLHRLNLSAIPISETEILADRYHFVELGSTRQLVVPAASPTSPGNEALLLGGIQFEMDSTAIGAANYNLSATSTASRGELGFETTDSTSRLAIELRGSGWKYLPATEKEVASIASMLTTAGLKPTVRQGFAATEESFKTIGHGKPSPRILHLATHGYFFPDPKEESSRQGLMDDKEPVYKRSEHPMIRSGLLLAGANFAWKTGKPLNPNMEDGILTAYEISQMDLSNTELVVLSACETGLGDIEGNEGVYGMQRAFKIAGARYIIMSLWQVPDVQTQELMTAFYNNWLTGNMPIPEAFRKAQETMRVKYEHPYFWAGFVLVE